MAEKKVVKRDYTVPSGKIGKSFRETGQILNFAQLQKILLQNASKTNSKTFTQYTKERIQSYIQNPLSNIDNIREVSNFLWRVSMPYRKIIEYYATMPEFSYNLILDNQFGAKLDTSSFLQNYYKVSKRMQNMHFREEMQQVMAKCLLNGIYVGFVYDDEESFILSPLEVKYCKVVNEMDGVYDVAFDATFFDTGNNQEYLTTEEGAWDDVFVQGYYDYKTKGNDFRWFNLPPEKTICIIAGDNPLVPLPFFVPIFTSLLDLIDYESLIRSKTELENTVLLLSKIPLIENSQEVDDFALNIDTVEAMQKLIDAVVPPLVGTAYSPCELEVIRFDNNNQVGDTNIYSESLKNLMSTVGISEMLWNSDKGGSVGLDASIKTDELFVFKLLMKIERWAQRYMVLNISTDFSVKFHKMTYFSKKTYLEQCKDLATLGVPVKMELATATGYTPFEIMNMTYMENAMELDTLWKPLASSYTQSSQDTKTSGIDDSELTEEGLKSRDGNKNQDTLEDTQ